jgi:hypothetical protein
MTLTCDYRHDEVEAEVPATWGLIGEAGDFYICDAHYAMRSPEHQRGWHRVEAP